MNENNPGNIVVGVLKWIGSVLATFVGSIVLVILGAVIAIYGIATDTGWITYTGITIGAFGAAWFSYNFLSD